MKDTGNKKDKIMSFPDKKLSLFDLFFFRIKSDSIKNYIIIIFLIILSSLTALIFPYLTKKITGDVLSLGSVRLLLSFGIFYITAELFSRVLSAVKNISEKRLLNNTRAYLNNALTERVFNMPYDYFNKYSAGELQSRMKSAVTLSDIFLSGALLSLISALSSFLFIFQIFDFARVLTLPSLIFLFLMVLITAFTSLSEKRIIKERVKADAKERGFLYDIIRGALKIKETGSKNEAITEWEKLYSKKNELYFDPPLLIKINPVLMTALKLISNIFIFYISGKYMIPESDYLAFSAAFGGLSSSVFSLSETMLSFFEIKSLYEMAEPVLNAVPNKDTGEIITSLHGGILLSHISFSYDENKKILDDISININPGEYIGITGKTGSGKTTLVRLLTGLLTPSSGKIFYDGKRSDKINKKSLRKFTCAVMQDGRLLTEDILKNITIGNPDAPLSDVWEALEIAGIKEDIKKMPLGLHTPVSEGAGGVSGGQKQRLLIARALLNKPKVLILDEATSALDLMLEKKIYDAVKKMNCTRIVITHRPESIKDCDRVFNMENGALSEVT